MRIIAVDDEPLALGLLVRSIQEACPAAQIRHFQSGHEALQFLESNRCDVAFLDIHMRGMDGLTLAKNIKERYDVLSWEVSRKVCGDVGMQGCRVGQVALTQAFHLPP